MRQGRGAPRRFSGQTLRARFAGTSAAKLGWPRRQGFQGKVAAVRLQHFLKVLRGGAFCQDGEAQPNMAMARRQGLSEIPRIPGSNRTRKICRIPGTNRAPEIPEICLRSSALSQAHLHQPIPGCTDKAQKQLAILLQHSCRFKRAHRCVLFARQLGCFESAIFRPPPRSVKNKSWSKMAAV